MIITKATPISKNGLALFIQMLVVLLHGEGKGERKKEKGESMQSFSWQLAQFKLSIPQFINSSDYQFLNSCTL
jgi:hypothetical protein